MKLNSSPQSVAIAVLHCTFFETKSRAIRHLISLLWVPQSLSGLHWGLAEGGDTPPGNPVQVRHGWSADKTGTEHRP